MVFQFACRTHGDLQKPGEICIGIPAASIPVYHYTKNGGLNLDDIQFWIDYMTKRGDLTVKFVTPAMVATNDYSGK